jgi:hypothetical protein
MEGMNRTYTPNLDPDVLDRLAACAAAFRYDFNRPRRAQWCGVYLRGLSTTAEHIRLAHDLDPRTSIGGDSCSP